MNKPRDCFGCDLHTLGQGFTRVTGYGTNQVMLMAPKLTRRDIGGVPLNPASKGGAMLERVIRSTTFEGQPVSRDQFLLWNLVACRPPDDRLEKTSWEFNAIRHCGVHRAAVIAKHQPKIIVAFGHSAFRALTGLSGKKLTLDHLRGYAVPTPQGTVVGTYDPEDLREGMQKLIPVFRHDLKYALFLAKYGYVQKPLYYQKEPTFKDAEAFLKEARQQRELPLSVDIETDPSHPDNPIISIQYSLRPQTGIFFPWSDKFKDISYDLLQLANDKLGHNIWRFDSPKLTSAGCKINGTVHDTLWAFHHLQPDLTIDEQSAGKGEERNTAFSTRMGLQYVASLYGMDYAWKHLADTQPEFYGISDVDAVQRIWARLPEQLKREGLWTNAEGIGGYFGHVLGLEPLLVELSATGIPVNETARLELRGDLEAQILQLEGTIQKTHPDELKNLYPENGYVRVPEEGAKVRRQASGLLGGSGGTLEWLDDEDEENPVWRPMDYRLFTAKKKVKRECKCVDVSKIVGKNGQVVKVTTERLKAAANPGCATCYGKGKQELIQTVSEHRYVKLLPFKASKDQLIRYMRHRGHNVPVKKAGRDKKETTEAKEIQRLFDQTKDPLYGDILQLRALTKIKSTYVDQWRPKVFEDYYDEAKKSVFQIGRVHAEYDYSPATQQLASRNPNAQNIPKHKELAKKFRAIIQAPPEHWLMEFDWTAFHALMTGFFARCPDYMRLAKLGIHDYLTADLVGKPADLTWADDKLASYLSKIKKEHKLIREKQAKPAVHGYAFGIQAGRLYTMNKEFYDRMALEKLWSRFRFGLPYDFTAITEKILDGWLTELKTPDMKKRPSLADLSKDEAQGTLDKMDGLFPRVAAWRKAVVLDAHNKHKLVNPYACIRRFEQVFEYQYRADDRGVLHPVSSPGDDTEDAIAFLPASSAFGHMKEVWFELKRQGWTKLAQLINQIHDAFLFLPHNSVVDRAMVAIREVMESASKVLIDPIVAPNGLAVGVGVSIGKKWSHMLELKDGTPWREQWAEYERKIV